MKLERIQMKPDFFIPWKGAVLGWCVFFACIGLFETHFYERDYLVQLFIGISFVTAGLIIETIFRRYPPDAAEVDKTRTEKREK